MIEWLLGGMVLESATGIFSDLFEGSFKSKAITYYKALKDVGMSDEDALRKTEEKILEWELDRELGSW